MHISSSWRAVAVTAALTLAGSGPAGASSSQSRPGDAWVGTWATAVTHGDATGSTNTGLTDQSVRLVVRPTVGGDKIRIRLSTLPAAKALPSGLKARPLTQPEVLEAISMVPRGLRPSTSAP